MHSGLSSVVPLRRHRRRFGGDNIHYFSLVFKVYFGLVMLTHGLVMRWVSLILQKLNIFLFSLLFLFRFPFFLLFLVERGRLFFSFFHCGLYCAFFPYSRGLRSGQVTGSRHRGRGKEKREVEEMLGKGREGAVGR